MDIQALKNKVAEYKDIVIELETLLTSNPALAPENGGDGEWEKCLALEAWLKNKGFDNIEFFNAPDERVSRKNRPNMCLTVPGESDDYNIWIMSHLDVVPAGDLSLWHSDPWKARVDGDKIYGRGTEDDQQGLVAGILAVLAYKELGLKPAHTIKLMFCADEEVGSTYGIQYLCKLPGLFKKEDLFIIPDGGDKLGQTIEIAEKNIAWVEFTLTGKQCHGSRPDEGCNACLAGSDLALTLHNELTAKFNQRDPMFEPVCSTFEPTMRKANVDGVNIIPGSDVFCMDMRVLPSINMDDVTATIEQICNSIKQKYGVAIEHKFLQFAHSPATDKNAPVVEKLKAALKTAHSIDAQLIGIGGGTVAAELRNLGFSCVVWGTLDECCHMPDEYALISNIIKDGQTLAVLAAL